MLLKQLVNQLELKSKTWLLRVYTTTEDKDLNTKYNLGGEKVFSKLWQLAKTLKIPTGLVTKFLNTTKLFKAKMDTESI